MVHSAGIMSSPWVWSSPCFLSLTHQSPSPSSAMLPGLLLTCAATRIHHRPWRLYKRWVCMHACLCRLSCARRLMYCCFAAGWVTQAGFLQCPFSSQISFITQGEFLTIKLFSVIRSLEFDSCSSWWFFLFFSIYVFILAFYSVFLLFDFSASLLLTNPLTTCFSFPTDFACPLCANISHRYKCKYSRNRWLSQCVHWVL